MEKTFKTLIFKGDRTKVLGRFAILEDSIDKAGELDWYGGNVPRLYSISCTIKKLENQLPKVDFRKVKLIIVKVSELQTNSS